MPPKETHLGITDEGVRAIEQGLPICRPECGLLRGVECDTIASAITVAGNPEFWQCLLAGLDAGGKNEWSRTIRAMLVAIFQDGADDAA